MRPKQAPPQLSIEPIRAARERLREAVWLSPCARSEALSALTGCRLSLKLENLQATGSFKLRGSSNKIALLGPAERAAGVITASAGNHAQGVAYAARASGIRATIVMPETAPLAKVAGTRELGAEVVLHGTGYDEAYAHAVALQARSGATFIHAFDDPDIIAGQGTIGLEIAEQCPAVEVVVVPVGGGGLAAGIAVALRALKPGVRLVGVQAEQMPGMLRSLEAHRIVDLRKANTLADGISVARVGEHTFPLVGSLVDQVVTVSEEEIATAVMVLLEKEKTLAEGAGAVGFAALYFGHVPAVAGREVVAVVSGGNIDMTALAKIIERGLEKDERLASLKIIVPDRPGSIAELAGIIARERANILNISQNRSFAEVGLGEAEVELTLETRGHAHAEAIRAAIADGGFALK